jgi:putative Mg2+ transporter-C (MgtC) family protein
MVMVELSSLEMVFKLLLAAALGGLIGLEREEHRHPAGFRTNIIVCITSAMITIAAAEFFPDPDSTARILTGVLTGVGFIGAGTIITDKNRVIGLTTAASLWSVTGIGIIIGFGYYILAVAFTIIVFVILKLKFVERKFHRSSWFGF